MSGSHQHTGSIRRGSGLAAVAAILFGVTAPLLQRASASSGVFVSGALIYLGAALAASLGEVASRGRVSASLRSRLPHARLAVVAFLGSTVAPALLVAGLKRVDGATASLLLALEAPLTIALARVLVREYVGRRVALAAVLITAGAVILVRGTFGGSVSFCGAVLVSGAALAWSLDNLVSRPLADLDPLRVVALKGLLGATMSGLVSVVSRESWPAMANLLPIVALGAVGYGLSLVIYLRAQHLVGAARTASIFATAPLFGATVAFLLGAPWTGAGFVLASALISAGIALHLTERHDHRHRHEPLEHDHLHRHDDGHHHHGHDPMPQGAHGHPHVHAAETHAHEHSEDVHHRHGHDPGDDG